MTRANYIGPAYQKYLEQQARIKGGVPADKYKSIAVKLAAFCCRLQGMDDVPEQVRDEAIKLSHEFRRVDAEK